MARESEPFISIVIPTFNEMGNVDRQHETLQRLLAEQPWKYEFVYVDDGSSDGSGKWIRKQTKDDPHVRFVAFTRNFGKEAALAAGIKAARGDAIMMVDSDAQFPVKMIPEFVAKWQEGAEVVVGVRKSNQREGFVKRYGSKLFYWMLGSLSDGQTVPGSTDFRLIDRRVADEFNFLTEHNRITRGLIDWLGYDRAYIDFHALPRENGSAGYTLKKMVSLAIHTFVAQSTRPLLFTGALGVLVMVVAVVLGLFMVVEQYVLGDPLHLGFTGTAVLAVFLSFLVGVVLGCQGLLALYVESIHNETQNRPLYVVRDEG
jgi:glycosyltransferase involved in cell wall biosynthesis